MAEDKTPYGPKSDTKYADPGYKPDGVARYPIDNPDHARAALSYFSMPKNHEGYTAEQVSQIMGRIKAACEKFGIKLSDDKEQRSDDQMRGPVEERAAALANVDFGQRILTVVAVPYEQHTPVEYRNERWNEVFSSSAFNGFDPSKRRVPVSAVLRAPAFDHNGGHLVGKVISAYPDRSEGLVLDMRISNTQAGDETLQLASDDALSPSVGFMARPGDHRLDRQTMTRRINRAFLDHLSMVPTPAYDGARVLSMRSNGDDVVSARDLPPLRTPSLDEFLSDPLFTWVDKRV